MTIPVATECPQPAELEEFLHDELPDERAALVESHVETCTPCQEMLESLLDCGSLESLLQRRAKSLLGSGVAADTDRGESAEDVPNSVASNSAIPNSPVDSQLAVTQVVGDAESTPLSIGGHQVVGEVGRGAFGVVYLARDETLHRMVAIKVPRAEVLEAAGGVEAYLKEARTLALLDHPNIVRVHEARSDGHGSCYVVSNYVDGLSLAARLEEGLPSHVEAARIVADVADALQHAHERGVYHRDIKPSNILLDREGKPYLADFGLALNESEMGLGPRKLGTPAFTSPEQARGEGHLVDGRTDVYSLGVVFYRMITGKRPFMARRVKEMLNLVANVDPPSARQRNQRVPLELDRICSLCLARLPSERYQSAHDFAADLRKWLERTTDAPTPVDPLDSDPAGASPLLPEGETTSNLLPSSRSHDTRRRWAIGLVSFVTLSVIGLFAFGPFGRSGDEPERPGDGSGNGSGGVVGTDEGRVVRLGIKPWVGYSPLVVARELGLCKDIDLQFVDVKSTAEVGRKVLARELEIAPYLVDSHALARANEIPTRVILLLDRSLEADAVVAQSGIESFADLKGHTVSYQYQEAPHFLLLSLCEKYDVDPNDLDLVTAVTPAEAVDMFVNARVDAVAAYDPFLKDALRERPGSDRIATAADVPGAILDIVAAREDWLEDHRPQVEALIDGWMQGLELLEKRDERALEIACRFLGTKGKPITVDEYDAMVAGMKYAGIEENRAFFAPDERGISEFHTRVEAAQERWARHRQLPRRTVPADGDASDILLEMYPEAP